VERALAEHLAQAPIFVRKFDGEILYWTEGAGELYGYDFNAAVGRISHQLLKTEFPRPIEDINRTLVSGGVWQGLLGHCRADGVHIWVESRWRLREGTGAEGSIVVETNTDVTQRENLSRELDHRVKNTLAVVQGLARLTFRRDAEGVREFEDRLRALAGAHDVLMQHNWGAAGLLEVIERAFSGLSIRDRIRLSGEDVQLRPNSVMAYLLAFHELGVNAVKHGSLSMPEGRVLISWQHGDDRLHVVWRELGGPRPSADRKPGSGTALFQRVVAAELGTPVKLRFDEAGLVCEFDGPVQKTSSLPEIAPGASTAG
jgi:PAS domain S-box-containing protein